MSAALYLFEGDMNRTVPAMLSLALVVALANILGHQPVLTPFLFLTLCASGAARFMSARAWRIILCGMLILSLGAALLAFAQIGVILRPKGPFASPNFLAGYAALHIFLALFMRAQAKRPRFYTAAAGVNLAALLLSQSLGGFLALASGLGIIAACRFRRWLLEFVCVTTALFAALTSVTPGRPALLDDPRISIWLQGWKVARWRLLTGYGQHNFFIPPNFTHFYNSALTLLVAAGVVGLGFGVWLLFVALRRARCWPQKEESLALRGFLVAWIVYSMFMYDTPETVGPLYVVLALLGSEAAIRRHEQDGSALVDQSQPLVDAASRTARAG